MDKLANSATEPKNFIRGIAPFRRPYNADELRKILKSVPKWDRNIINTINDLFSGSVGLGENAIKKGKQGLNLVSGGSLNKFLGSFLDVINSDEEKSKAAREKATESFGKIWGNLFKFNSEGEEGGADKMGATFGKNVMRFADVLNKGAYYGTWAGYDIARAVEVSGRQASRFVVRRAEGVTNFTAQTVGRRKARVISLQGYKFRFEQDVFGEVKGENVNNFKDIIKQEILGGQSFDAALDKYLWKKFADQLTIGKDNEFFPNQLGPEILKAIQEGKIHKYPQGARILREYDIFKRKVVSLYGLKNLFKDDLIFKGGLENIEDKRKRGNKRLTAFKVYAELIKKDNDGNLKRFKLDSDTNTINLNINNLKIDCDKCSLNGEIKSKTADITIDASGNIADFKKSLESLKNPGVKKEVFAAIKEAFFRYYIYNSEEGEAKDIKILKVEDAKEPVEVAKSAKKAELQNTFSGYEKSKSDVRKAIEKLSEFFGSKDGKIDFEALNNKKILEDTEGSIIESIKVLEANQFVDEKLTKGIDKLIRFDYKIPNVNKDKQIQIFKDVSKSEKSIKDFDIGVLNSYFFESELFTQGRNEKQVGGKPNVYYAGLLSGPLIEVGRYSNTIPDINLAVFGFNKNLQKLIKSGLSGSSRNSDAISKAEVDSLTQSEVGLLIRILMAHVGIGDKKETMQKNFKERANMIRTKLDFAEIVFSILTADESLSSADLPVLRSIKNILTLASMDDYAASVEDLIQKITPSNPSKTPEVTKKIEVTLPDFGVVKGLIVDDDDINTDPFMAEIKDFDGKPGDGFELLQKAIKDNNQVELKKHLLIILARRYHILKDALGSEKDANEAKEKMKDLLTTEDNSTVNSFLKTEGNGLMEELQKLLEGSEMSLTMETEEQELLAKLGGFYKAPETTT